MSTGTFPSILGMIVRSSPAPVIARVGELVERRRLCIWTGDGDSSRPGAARTALPPTVCEQPAMTMTAAHQTNKGLADTGMASSPSRIETNRIEYR